ncbi:hypothetical protein J4436_04575 [Candidatus Woesearchaeota archaeon]|nr:hypothetical protein [Candidatus Woesearchaeota archaeon]
MSDEYKIARRCLMCRTIELVDAIQIGNETIEIPTYYPPDFLLEGYMFSHGPLSTYCILQFYESYGFNEEIDNPDSWKTNIVFCPFGKEYKPL